MVGRLIAVWIILTLLITTLTFITRAVIKSGSGEKLAKTLGLALSIGGASALIATFILALLITITN